MMPHKLIKAIEKYNAYDWSLSMDNRIFDSLISARNTYFRKKILLVNLRAAPTNAHMERAFMRAFEAAGASGKSMALDIFHSFGNDDVVTGSGNRTGFRIRYSGMSVLKDFMEKTEYAALVFIDLPYKDEELVPYAWLALRDKTPEKFFIANDVLLPRGDIFGIDLAEDLRLLKDFSAGYILNQNSARDWGRFGLPRGRSFKRNFAVDCVYFDGKGSSEGDYAYSFGRAARDFDALFKAAGAMPRGLKLKIYTDLNHQLPAKLKSLVEFVPYPCNSLKMKNLIAGAKFVVLPIGRDHGLPGAGLSAALMAMAMGKIVLTRGNSCIHQYLKNGVNAFTYQQSGAAVLARGMKRILGLEYEQKKQIAANARETVLKLNNMESFVNGFVNKHCCQGKWQPGTSR